MSASYQLQPASGSDHVHNNGLMDDGLGRVVYGVAIELRPDQRGGNHTSRQRIMKEDRGCTRGCRSAGFCNTCACMVSSPRPPAASQATVCSQRTPGTARPSLCAASQASVCSQRTPGTARPSLYVPACVRPARLVCAAKGPQGEWPTPSVNSI